MERTMLESLDDVPLTQIQRYVADSCQALNRSAHTLVYSFTNRSARLIDAHRNGLDGPRQHGPTGSIMATVLSHPPIFKSRLLGLVHVNRF
jgi:hypothetical protein